MYPKVISEESNTEPHIEQTDKTGGKPSNYNAKNGANEVRNESIAESITKTAKFERVKAMLEQNKKIDETQQHMEHQQEVVTAGRQTLSMNAEMSETEVIIEKRILNFV